MSKYYTKSLCFYCGQQMTFNKGTYKHVATSTSVDHKQPVSRGGAHTIENNVICCRRCNTQKGCLTFEEFRLVLAYRNHKIGEADFKFFGELHPDYCNRKLKDTI